jgi:uncharacterized membrane protein YccC
MDLLVATWTLRIAVVAALAVGGVSYSVGTPAIEAVDRAMAAAVAFTFAGRWFAGWLEPPERRLVRMRIKREQRRMKSAKSARSGSAPRAEAGEKSAARAKSKSPSKSTSTVSRSA